jgi:hypothetical protein
VLCAVGVFFGEKIAAITFLQFLNKIFVGLYVAQRGGKILQCRRERVRSSAMGSPQKNIKIRPGTLGQLLVGPGVTRPAPVKVDMGCDDGFWNPPVVP